jgi:mannosyl-oligosaccharide glucosidase
MWQAHSTHPYKLFERKRVIYSLISGFILKALIDKARQIIAPYQNSGSSPHPSFVFQLPNDVHAGSNLFAFQKHFDGAFQFDVFFDSGSVKQKLTRT